MRPLVRYVWSDTLRGHSWIGPTLCFFVVEAIICAQTGSVVPTYAASAVALLFISTWVTIATVNNEDAVQYSITVVSAGSPSEVRLAKLAVAALMGAALSLVGVVGPLLTTSFDATTADVVAGAVAQLLTVSTGVAFGALLSRPVVTKKAWAVLVGFGICLATVVIPYGPPARQLLVLFDQTGQFALSPTLLLVALETIGITTVAVYVSLRLTRWRD